MSWWSFKPYVSVAQRQAKAKREVEKLRKKGQTITPVHIEGKAIATTFWGKAWCENLESYSDYDNRLPRGRSYVKNGSVCDLQVAPGVVTALVCGSELYHITVKIKPLAKETWAAVKRQCAGQIGSLVELLQGKLSKAVMEVVTRKDGGLFPAPGEIDLDCSCPDWADMCKHVAAVLYGVGARLDRQPELLFTLRKVDHLELIAQAGDAGAVGQSRPRKRVIAAGDLADVFGVELEATDGPPSAHVASTAKTSPMKPSPTKASPVKAAPTKVAPAKAAFVKATPTRSANRNSQTARGRSEDRRVEKQQAKVPAKRRRLVRG
jgi:uncharacterized Zn finger protein